MELENIDNNIPQNHIETNEEGENQPVIDIHSIQQRTTSPETLSLIRRVLALRDDAITIQLWQLEESLFDIFLSNYVFLFSPLVLLIILFCLYIELSSIVFKDNFTTKTLETEVMFYSYILIFSIAVIVVWNLYLLFFKLLTCFESYSQNRREKSLEWSSADIVFFNPFYVNLVLYYYDKKYLNTVLDLIVIMTISSIFTINFFFTDYYNSYLKNRISKITNIHSIKSKMIKYKIKIFFAFLIGMNLLVSYLITYLSQEGDYYFSYIMQVKSIYLIIRQIGMWYEAEDSYNQLDSVYSTNEVFYKNAHFKKTVMRLIGMIVLAQVMVFGNFLFFKNGDFSFFFPCSIVSVGIFIAMYKTYKKYDEIKTFYDEIDERFPEIDLHGQEHECIICTESLTKARRLACNHSFHL